MISKEIHKICTYILKSFYTHYSGCLMHFQNDLEEIDIVFNMKAWLLGWLGKDEKKHVPVFHSWSLKKSVTFFLIRRNSCLPIEILKNRGGNISVRGCVILLQKRVLFSFILLWQYCCLNYPRAKTTCAIGLNFCVVTQYQNVHKWHQFQPSSLAISLSLQKRAQRPLFITVS